MSLGSVGDEAWGDRTFIEFYQAPIGATCSVQLRFPSGVVLDLGTHTITAADSPRYRIWWVVPDTAGSGWVQGKALCVLGSKRAGGDWGYLTFRILGGTHRPEPWSISLYDDGFGAQAGTRSNIRVTTTRIEPGAGSTTLCSAAIHLPGGIEVAIAQWAWDWTKITIWYDIPADTPAGPASYDVTCSSPNETKVAHGKFNVWRSEDPTVAPPSIPLDSLPPVPTAAPTPTPTPTPSPKAADPSPAPAESPTT